MVSIISAASLAWAGIGIISVTGTCAAAASSCTLSATKTGDLQIFVAVDVGSATIPSLPGSTTSIVTTTGGSSTSEVTVRIFCKDASSSGDTGSGTATNAVQITGISYAATGVTSTAACNTSGIGGIKSATGANASTTMTCGNIVSMTHSDGTSWVACAQILGQTTPCSISGMIQKATSGSGASSSIYDTETGVSSWATQTCTTATSSNVGYVMEILANHVGGSVEF